jgi:short-subunit dehydrogenase
VAPAMSPYSRTRSAIYVMMLRGYKDRVAVITGAAQGLGRALAHELAERKCHLALIDRDASGLVTAKEELERPGMVVTQHCADVGSEQALERAAAEIRGAHGTVHLLINNAGVSASATFANTATAVFEQIMRVNFFGVVYGCRVFLPALQKHGEGQILNVSSCFAWLGYPRKTAYASSKGAVRAFSESLRLELHNGGVGVTVLYPGPLPTSLVHSGVADSAERRDREEKFLAKRGLPMDRVVRRCLDELLTNPERIVIGLDYRLLDLLARFSPRMASKAIGLAATRAGF